MEASLSFIRIQRIRVLPREFTRTPSSGKAIQKGANVKRNVRKLHLNRETLRSLDDSTLQKAEGGYVRPVQGGSNEISICVTCTGRLDTCPDQTATIG
jgi:hypothetical protein